MAGGIRSDGGTDPLAAGWEELRTAARPGRPLLWQAAIFGAFVNLLMLTGPLYMLQVYDRVLTAHSVETLTALSLLAVFLYAIMAVLDHARARLIARAGAGTHDRMGARVFAAALSRLAQHPDDPRAEVAQRDLDLIRGAMAAPVVAAFFDLPWTPLFLGAIFVFHPLLGIAATAGGAGLVLLTLGNRLATRGPGAEASEAAARAARLSAQLRAEAGTVRALGMAGAGYARWRREEDTARDAGLRLGDRHSGFAAATRGLRLTLQSALLGLGAWLVLRDALTPGAMVATSVLVGRALAPVELILGQWTVLSRASGARHRLAGLLSGTPAPATPLALPPPRSALSLSQVTVMPPGSRTAALRAVSFEIAPGQAMGVIGPTGAGKTALARALAGLWPPTAGSITLGGAPLGRYAPDMLGRHLGYLPQQVVLFEGTLAENIARFEGGADPCAVIAAARQAGAHEMILALPDGYETRVSPAGALLSAGQLQRIGLARALYRDPALLILDEPDAHLDATGGAALNAAIRGAKAAGRAVLVMAHRRSAVQECDQLMILEAGNLRAIGPREQVLSAKGQVGAGQVGPGQVAPGQGDPGRADRAEADPGPRVSLTPRLVPGGRA
ncbi:type I secretion system permease/ATPase [Acidimangrovimonas sediminis]|uniref:type I secretion system permease/ATPase n=1 Tax=Acidimangrovimonas sediminis TaxID=2056283 RepID=UPI000C7F7C26|nr:type I secretion system permease/ATPase [Acidimangrovimonas sediminis]